MIEFTRLWLGLAALVFAVAAPAAEPEDVSLSVSTIAPGLGDSPAPTDMVFVRYRGMLEDGTVFDESRDLQLPPEAHGLFPEGTPLPLAELIPGFQEGIVQMQKGGKYRLFIPSDKAYGAESQTDPQTGVQVIPPNSNLIFEIELVDFMSRGEFDRRVVLFRAAASQPVSISTIAPGLGSNPGPDDVAFIRYRGMLEDGTVFDEASELPVPVPGIFPAGMPMPLDNVIPGFQEGIIQMQKGGKYRLWIPAEKAYGAAGSTDRQTGEQVIPPNADLIFEIELVDFMSRPELDQLIARVQQAMAAAEGGEGAE